MRARLGGLTAKAQWPGTRRLLETHIMQRPYALDPKTLPAPNLPSEPSEHVHIDPTRDVSSPRD